MIDYLAFWKGPDAVDRRVTYASAFSPALEANGSRTVDACAPLIAEYEAATGRTIDRCSSGWRPKVINDHTANSGASSAHITAEAEDVTGHSDLLVRPSVDGGYACSQFAMWCARHLDRLKAHGLYMEDWHYTARKHDDGTWGVWCHLSPRSPKSGNTMYMPFNPTENPPPIPLTEHAI